jgi:hypothetical protein
MAIYATYLVDAGVVVAGMPGFDDGAAFLTDESAVLDDMVLSTALSTALRSLSARSWSGFASRAVWLLGLLTNAHVLFFTFCHALSCLL